MVSLEQMTSSDKMRSIILWLKATDPSVNYNRAIRAHHPGTGKWFLDSIQFQGWKNQSNSFLCLHGLSGCGKTILSAAIIQHLRDQRGPPILYFYFDFSDPNKQHFEDMLRSLLSQLYHESPVARTVINALFDSHSNGTQQLIMEQMKDTLVSILERSEHATIVIDALDEAEKPRELVQWCQAIYNSQTFKVRLLVTSRTQLPDWSDKTHVACLGLERVNEDVKYYTRHRLYSREFENWASQDTLRDEVEATIVQRAGGM